MFWIASEATENTYEHAPSHLRCEIPDACILQLAEHQASIFAKDPKGIIHLKITAYREGDQHNELGRIIQQMQSHLDTLESEHQALQGLKQELGQLRRLIGK